MTAPKTLDALIRERSPEEVAQLRAIADRMAERAMLSRIFEQMIWAHYQADPAAVSPRMGFA